MKDPIERQDAINAIEYELEMINSALDSITLDFNARERLRQRRGEAREILNSIQQLPSAQSERETATWIIDSGYPQHCWCSNCNHRFDLFDPKSIHFCPNCGREMKTCVWKSLDEREEE